MLRHLDFKRDILPHLLAVALFLALTVAYFTPIFLEGKTLMQYDVQQFQGVAKELVDYREKTGEEALWTNSLFGGMPAYLISTRYSGDLISHVQWLMTLNLPAVAANLFVTLLCGYLLMVVVGLRPILAVCGAIALSFTTYNMLILEAGHNSKSYAIAFVPLVLAGLIITFRKTVWRNIILGVAVFTIGLALQLRVNHVQITYYLMFMVLIYGIVELVFAVKEGRLKSFFSKVALLFLGAVLAAGVSFGRLYTTTTYGEYSIRGKSELNINNAGDKKSEALDRDYAFNYSYGILESMTILIPEFYGGANSVALSTKSETGQALSRMGVPPGQLNQVLENIPLYWGGLAGTSGPVYFGAIVCFLFVLGLYLVDKRVRYWLLGATILSLMFAWGKNFETFNYFMFDYFPAYNKFRAVSMALVIAQVAMPLLGILGLSVFLNSKNSPELRKKLFYSAGITAGICLLMILVAGTFDFVGQQDEQLAKMGFPVDAIRADRAGALRGDAFRSIFFILAAGAVLYLFLLDRLSRNVALGVVALLILVDLWTVDRRYLSTEKFAKNGKEAYFQPTVADQSILQDKELYYRVFNPSAGLTSDGRTSYYHKSIGGYHGAKLRRYQDVIENHLSRGNMEVFNMLNTKYIISKPEEPAQQNPNALGNAWFVSQVRTVTTPDDELAALNDIKPATEAVVDKAKFTVSNTSYNTAGNTVKLTEYEPNRLKYAVNAANPGLIVFSDIYYERGWNAYLNGQKTDHIRVNYILRGLEVPAGNHTVEFKFEPKEFAIGNTVSLISSILILLFVAGAVFINIKAKNNDDDKNIVAD